MVADDITLYFDDCDQVSLDSIIKWGGWIERDADYHERGVTKSSRLWFISRTYDFDSFILMLVVRMNSAIELPISPITDTRHELYS